MKCYFLIIGLSILSLTAVGQEKEVEIIASILEDSDAGKRLSEVTISVCSNGQEESSVASKPNGKIPKFRVSTGKYYQIYIKKEGYVTKMVELDARIDSIAKAPNLLFLKFETGLFKTNSQIDPLAIENKPIVKFYFDQNYFYTYDEAYTLEMLKVVEELKNNTSVKDEALK